ncbi:hypothetical protein A1O7_03340 [Cladophialophora yegresii CBS 114405]|uniref:DNA2/NAM7 helicase-like C-terminal domain-containing protein n=1 Tax=Cladophialophora yegresii CBS 114405 TaxID=1182544 RepID=W9W4A5_9EURO|nr:uncharacterized protein A1O7_03340 [Cladophialophora yegresii CBS 114405]EXJ62897.1 hypothetical protein A1O7_03340 [Cladophialophora yegresii CBS 114405]
MARRYNASVFRLDPFSTKIQQGISDEELHTTPVVTSPLTHDPTWDAKDPLGISLSKPATTSLPDICHAREKKITYVAAGDIFFHVSPTYTSYLQLSFHLEDDSAPGGRKQTCIRLTRDTCLKLAPIKINKELYSELLPKTTPTFTSYSQFPLSVQYDTGRFFSENMFIESPSHSLLHLQKAFKSASRLTVLIEDTTYHFRQDLESLITKFRIWEGTYPLQPQTAFLDGKGMSRALASNPEEPARASFFSSNDYFATLGVGTKILREAKEKADREDFECAIHVISAEEGDRNRYYAIFKVPRDQGRLAGFSSGDRATVAFKDDNGATSWSMHVIEPIPWSGNGVVTACLEFGKDVTSPRRLRLTPVPRGRGGSGFRKILEGPGLKATVCPEARHSEFPYIMDAFDILRSTLPAARPGSMGMAVCRFLVGNKPGSIPKKDIYGLLANKDLAAEQNMDLNDGQKTAISMARCAPAGFVLCHGGPGTGKTHFVVEAVKPFLLDGARKHHVLLTAQGNRATDALAIGLERRLHGLIGSGQVPRSQYLVRLHSIKTERSIFLRGALTSRREKLRSGAAQAQSKTGTKAVASLPRQEEEIRAHCQTFTACKYEFVDDKRVEHLELSVGHRMRQIAGLEPDGPHLLGEDLFSEFAGLYQRFSDGKELHDDVMMLFHTGIEELMAYTISNAAAVCATVAGAADAVFTKNYSEAELIVVDEASRIAEYYWWPLLAYFPNAVGKIMVGDHFQLPPRVDEDIEMRNPCQPQLEMSLQERAQTIGMRAAFFTVQYRAMPEITEIYSKVCYQSRLTSDPSTYLERRPLAGEIVHHNTVHYGIAKPLIFFDIPSAVQKKSGSTIVCVTYANLVLRILQGLLTAGFGSTKPCTIAILAPYKSELNMLWVAKREMAEEVKGAAAAKNVFVETADKVQGMEYDIVIVDPVATHFPGFLTMQRLNVLFSRAKYGLYVCGNLEAWRNMRRDGSEWIQAFGSALAPHATKLSDAELRGSVVVSTDW